MNRDEIFAILDKYNFDKNEILILSGAAMVINGVKDVTADIDLAVSTEYEKDILKKYDCKVSKENNGSKVYIIDDKIEFAVNYYDSLFDIKNGYKVQKLSEIIKLKERLNREKDIKDIKLIKNFISINTMNSLALAYLGDAIYEIYIRKYLISKGICKVNELQKEAIKYVSAKAQSDYLEKMLNDSFLTDEEVIITKRARNHKSHGSKSVDIITYKKSTGLEALIGYLELSNNKKRIEEIMNFIVGD